MSVRSLWNLAFEEIRASYEEQIEALVDGGVDLIFIETIFDTLNAKAAVFAYEQYFKRVEKQKLPLFVRCSDGRFQGLLWMQVVVPCQARPLRPFISHLNMPSPFA